LQTQNDPTLEIKLFGGRRDYQEYRAGVRQSPHRIILPFRALGALSVANGDFCEKFAARWDGEDGCEAAGGLPRRQVYFVAEGMVAGARYLLDLLISVHGVAHRVRS